jgi:hypothetical protein
MPVVEAGTQQPTCRVKIPGAHLSRACGFERAVLSLRHESSKSKAQSRAVDSHLRYLKREGVTREGERGQPAQIRQAWTPSCKCPALNFSPLRPGRLSSLLRGTVGGRVRWQGDPGVA